MFMSSRKLIPTNLGPPQWLKSILSSRILCIWEEQSVTKFREGLGRREREDQTQRSDPLRAYTSSSLSARFARRKQNAVRYLSLC